ncbi:MAG: CRTAC1 family protein [Planctomycetes bacterium]|nr:CRTAC1 family protein [Planctomycetota bacterium]
MERSEQLVTNFKHVSGINKEKHFPAANGSGVAILDFDGDGLLDLYFLTACPLPVAVTTSSPRNSAQRRRPDGTHEEIGPMAGLDLAAFCQGVTVGDVNNDGFSDVLIVALGGNHLYSNQGDGTFRDVSVECGIVDRHWGASAAFLDYDEDGSLDFYVANYGLWSMESNLFCGDPERNIRLFCRPTYITPDVHSLYRNRGDGTFEWATERAGIARSDGRGQGVVAADLNGDGHVDLYVANDMSPHFLFLGRGDGTFKDFTILSGAAYDADGKALAGMGVDATDLDGDGLPELFATHFAHEYNTLYHNLGEGFFEDIASLSGLGPDSLPDVGWGTMLVDLDNDGLPDALVVNGHVDDNLAEMGRAEPYRQKAKVWRNRGGLRFEDVSDRAGDYFTSAHVSRGAAFGDLDDDGRLDVVVCNLDEAPAVLMNHSNRDAGWVRFRLIGRRSNRDAIGSVVELQSEALHVWRAVKGGGSYESAHDLRVLIGVGQATRVDQVTITWPQGAKTNLANLDLQQTYSLVEPTDAETK